jgi:hypothetical protein
MTTDANASRAPRVVSGATPSQPGWRTPTVDVLGASQSAWLSPPGFSLWQLVGALGEDARLHWSYAHGDEVVWVRRGHLRVDGDECGPGETLVVESGVPLEAVAGEATEVVHFGPTDPAPPTGGHYGPAATSGHGAHIVASGGLAALVVGPRDTRFLADSRCATCRPTLLLVRGEEAWESTAHSHSEDELVHVLDGTLRLGAYRAEEGDTIAMPADLRYRLRSDGAFAFLNYRRDVAFQTVDRHAEPVLETSDGNGFLLVSTPRRV